MRVACPECKQAYRPKANELKVLFGKSKAPKQIRLHRAKGCNSCFNTGYHGRKSVYEILRVSPQIRRMIVHGSDSDAINEQAIKEGMKTLHQTAVQEVLKGVTTLDELTRVVDIRMN
jgi:type IV pilus assembly protein PilB